MKKSLTKIFFTILGLIVLFIAGLSLAANIWLLRAKGQFLAASDQMITDKLSIGKILFMIPNQIVMKNVAVENTAGEKALLQCQAISARLSLTDLLFKGKVVISRVDVVQPDTDYPRFKQFLNNNGQSLMELLSDLPQSDFTFRLRHARFKDHGHDLVLVKRKDHFSGKGTFRLNKEQSYTYRVKGDLVDDGIQLALLTVRGSNLYFHWWGELQNSLLRLNGYMMLGTSETDPSAPPQGRGIYLLDIDSRIRLSWEALVIERLQFTLNRNAITMKGHVQLQDSPQWDLLLSYYPSLTKKNHREQLKRADLLLAGTISPAALHTNGHLQLYFDPSPNSNTPVELVYIGFHGLTLDFHRHPQWEVHMGQGDLAFWTNENEHRATWQNLKATLNLFLDQLKHAEVTADLYEGTLNGKMWIDTRQFPFRLTAVGRLKDLKANQLDELLVHFSKIHAPLSSEINFSNDPDIRVSGSIRLGKGTLKDYDFFNWLGDTFHLPSVKEIHFQEATSTFLVNPEMAGINNIRLTSPDVKITGYYRIDMKGLVGSILQLAFSKNLLRESSKCRAFLKFFAEDRQDLDFDFRLSGNQHAMNFQWTESATKSTITDHIPDFIERMIERRLDQQQNQDSENL